MRSCSLSDISRASPDMNVRIVERIRVNVEQFDRGNP
jgi:hypothetical protein